MVYKHSKWLWSALIKTQMSFHSFFSESDRAIILQDSSNSTQSFTDRVHEREHTVYVHVCACAYRHTYVAYVEDDVCYVLWWKGMTSPKPTRHSEIPQHVHITYLHIHQYAKRNLLQQILDQLAALWYVLYCICGTCIHNLFFIFLKTWMVNESLIWLDATFYNISDLLLGIKNHIIDLI